MTTPAAIPTFQIECKARSATRRSNKSGDWMALTLEVHPDDWPEEMYDMAKRQARVQCVLVEIGDDEQPVAKPAPPKPKEKPHQRWEDLSNCQQAGIRCGDVAFWEWLGVATEEAAAHNVRRRCDVDSRTELDAPAHILKDGLTWPPAIAWQKMDHQFRIDTGREQEPR